MTGFEILESGGAAERRAAIPPDLATCDGVPRARCGTRATGGTAIPSRTAPRAGRASPSRSGRRTTGPPRRWRGSGCAPPARREYARPRGPPLPRAAERVPRLRAAGRAPRPRRGAGPPARGSRSAALGAALAAGAIAAVKGIGGYHLACDATSPAAVRTLRERKRREEKPLAVMVRDLAAARAVADLGPAEEALLASVERPIVLCRRRAGARPRPRARAGQPARRPRPPVRAAPPPPPRRGGPPARHDEREPLRRANRLRGRGRAPPARRDRRPLPRPRSAHRLALRRLGGARRRGAAARAPPRARVRAAPGARRAAASARPVLGVGAQLKNACCLARGDEAVLGPHVGDLDGLETYGAFEAAVARLEAFLALRPEALACDLHPLYLSTRYARERAAALGVPLVEVQHHHAHAAAAHGRARPRRARRSRSPGTAPASGRTGPPGGASCCSSSAGGSSGSRRSGRCGSPAATGRSASRGASRSPPSTTPSGARRRSTRCRSSRAVDAQEREVVRRMLAGGREQPRRPRRAGAPSTRPARSPSAGPVSRFEGQVALALDAAAAGGPAPRPTRSTSTRPARSRSSTCARPGGRSRRTSLAGRAGRERSRPGSTRRSRAPGPSWCGAPPRRTGVLPVVLTGGCFQNARLAEGLLGELSGSFRVYQHEQVPPGDGGIALGQAIVADATLALTGGGDGTCVSASQARSSPSTGSTRPWISSASARSFGSTSSTSRSRVGDYVLNHVGFAIRRIPPEEVQETLALFDQILERLGGEGRPHGGRRPRRDRGGEGRPSEAAQDLFAELKFRDPARARALAEAIAAERRGASAGPSR